MLLLSFMRCWRVTRLIQVRVMKKDNGSLPWYAQKGFSRDGFEISIGGVIALVFGVCVLAALFGYNPLKLFERSEGQVTVHYGPGSIVGDHNTVNNGIREPERPNSVDGQAEPPLPSVIEPEPERHPDSGLGHAVPQPQAPWAPDEEPSDEILFRRDVGSPHMRIRAGRDAGCRTTRSPTEAEIPHAAECIGRRHHTLRDDELHAKSLRRGSVIEPSGDTHGIFLFGNVCGVGNGLLSLNIPKHRKYRGETSATAPSSDLDFDG